MYTDKWMQGLLMITNEEQFVMDVLEMRNPQYKFRVTPRYTGNEDICCGTRRMMVRRVTDAETYWRKIRCPWNIHKDSSLQHLFEFIHEVEEEVKFTYEVEHRV
jgi:hypothetical protein